MNADPQRLLAASRRLAIVGLSAKPDRDSHSITRYLIEHGFDAIGINPAYPEAAGVPCYPSLGETPPDVLRSIDLVVVFRRPDDVPAILEECARLALDAPGLRHVWLQNGVSSPAARETAERLALEVVHDQCVAVIHSLDSSRD